MHESPSTPDETEILKRFTTIDGWIFGFRISDRIGPFTPSRARSPINAKSLQSQGWECRKRPSGSGKLARSRYTQVGARSVHTPMAGWPAGALVPSSPKVRLGLDHRSAHAHDSPRPSSPAWLLRFDGSGPSFKNTPVVYVTRSYYG